ncbi:hypothetical protein HYU95_00615 [Candidatus Daviesbacteria bacterium]|nr:hypothetical protein [Candidatus Daviesbacteria bacterium]
MGHKEIKLVPNLVDPNIKPFKINKPIEVGPPGNSVATFQDLSRTIRDAFEKNEGNQG